MKRRPRIAGAVRSALGRGRPVLLFLAGPNGAGKSTFFRVFIQPQLGPRLPFVNADEIARALREAGPSTSDEEFDRHALAKTEEIRESLLGQKLSFCTETVFSDPSGAKLAFIRRARALGYAVILVFIGVDGPQLSTARVMQRVSEGGHDVPDQKLRKRFPRTLANLRAAVPQVDEAFLFDNSSDDEPFRPVAVYSDGKLVRSFDTVPGWAADLPGLTSR